MKIERGRLYLREAPARSHAMQHFSRWSDAASDHLAATPPGFDVTVRVKLVEMDGRRLAFEVEAHDGIDLITRGKHERFIIQKSKFDHKIEEKTRIQS